MRATGKLDYFELPAVGATLDRAKAFYSQAFGWAFTDYGPTYAAFNEGLETALVRLASTGEGCAVFLLDLDHFKEVNDRFGHPAGDEFLTQLAARLRRCTRDTDFVARARSTTTPASDNRSRNSTAVGRSHCCGGMTYA